jgi:ABC-type phosphate/phosphonate transport system substrate-binding protein
MIASLPMYDRAETASANDILWQAIAEAYPGPAPKTLTRSPDPTEDWQRPDLFLSQTCGLPFRAGLHERVTLVATPDYGVEGCEPGYYRSVVVAARHNAHLRTTDYADVTLAFNDPLSQSGWAAACAHAEGAVFAGTLRTGGHSLSAQAVAEGRADIAFIDAVTWDQIARWDAFSDDLVVIDRTRPTPGLPLITAQHGDAADLRAAIERALGTVPSDILSTLRLRGLATIKKDAYFAQPIPREPLS